MIGAIISVSALFIGLGESAVCKSFMYYGASFTALDTCTSMMTNGTGTSSMYSCNADSKVEQMTYEAVGCSGDAATTTVLPDAQATDVDCDSAACTVAEYKLYTVPSGKTCEANADYDYTQGFSVIDTCIKQGDSMSMKSTCDGSMEYNTTADCSGDPSKTETREDCVDNGDAGKYFIEIISGCSTSSAVSFKVAISAVFAVVTYAVSM